MNEKYRTGRRVMLSGVILLALVHLCGYLPTAEPNNLPINWTRITEFVPVWAWVTGWGLTVIMGIIELAAGKGRRAISLTVALSAASAATYLASYIVTVNLVGWGSREWFYFGVYLAVATIIVGLLTKVGALKQEERPSDG
jgi:hypothetical protein